MHCFLFLKQACFKSWFVNRFPPLLLAVGGADKVIAPAIRSGKRVCICGHENNLRSLLKYVDGISNSVRRLRLSGPFGLSASDPATLLVQRLSRSGI